MELRREVARREVVSLLMRRNLSGLAWEGAPPYEKRPPYSADQHQMVPEHQSSARHFRLTKMAPTEGLVEIPDSEEEPMTSSPVTVSDKASEMIRSVAHTHHVETQDAQNQANDADEVLKLHPVVGRLDEFDLVGSLRSDRPIESLNVTAEQDECISGQEKEHTIDPTFGDESSKATERPHRVEGSSTPANATSEATSLDPQQKLSLKMLPQSCSDIADGNKYITSAHGPCETIQTDLTKTIGSLATLVSGSKDGQVQPADATQEHADELPHDVVSDIAVCSKNDPLAFHTLTKCRAFHPRCLS